MRTCLTLLLASIVVLRGTTITSIEVARTSIIGNAKKLIGVRELTGHNDGPMVEKFLSATGNQKGEPWCASFNYYVYQISGFAKMVPRSAWSPDWSQNPTWSARKGGIEPLPADTFGIYFASLGRVGHTGIVEKWGETVTTIEGNTNPGGSRDGDGVYRRRRLRTQIYRVRSWL